MRAPHARRQRAAHRKPHHDFGALEAAELGELGDGHGSELLGIVLEEVEEFLVPRGIVEARALAVDLVRQTAGGDDRDLQVLGVALDGATQRLSELVEAARLGHGELQHAHCKRYHRHRPRGLVGTKHGQRRENPVIQRPVLIERHVELVGHERVADVRRKRRMTLRGRQVAGARAFVRNRPRVCGNGFGRPVCRT